MTPIHAPQQPVAPTVATRTVPTPKLLAVKDAATVMSVHENSVYRLMAEGELRYVAVGRRKLIPIEAIDEYIAEHVS